MMESDDLVTVLDPFEWQQLAASIKLAKAATRIRPYVICRVVYTPGDAPSVHSPLLKGELCTDGHGTFDIWTNGKPQKFGLTFDQAVTVLRTGEVHG